MDELARLYADAGKEGVYFREFDNAGHYLAAAGLIADLEPLEQALREAGVLAADAALDVQTLEMGDLVEVSVPAVGESREQACRAAWDALKEWQQERQAHQAELTAVAAAALPLPPRPSVPAGRSIAAVARLIAARSDFSLSAAEHGLALARLERLLAEAGGEDAEREAIAAVMEADRQERLTLGADTVSFVAWNSLGNALFEADLDITSVPVSVLAELGVVTTGLILAETSFRDEPVAPLWQFTATFELLAGVDELRAFAATHDLSGRDLDHYLCLLSVAAGASAVDFFRAGRVARTLEILEGWLYLP